MGGGGGGEDNISALGMFHNSNDVLQCTHDIPQRTEHPTMHCTHVIQGDKN